MAAALKAFAWLGGRPRGFLHLRVGARARVVVENQIVNDVAELEALGVDRIAELVNLGAATHELTLPGGRPRVVDLDLLADAAAAQEREQRAIDFDISQEAATQRNERERIQRLTAPAKKER